MARSNIAQDFALAKSAVRELEAVSWQLEQSKPTICFFQNLTVQLGLVQVWLDSFTDPERISEDRLKSLLNILEHLSTRSNKTKDQPVKQPYSGLKLLRGSNYDAYSQISRIGCSAGAGGEERRRNVIRNLQKKALAPSTTLEEGSVSSTLWQEPQPDEIFANLCALHSALSSHRTSKSSDKSKTRILVANMCLARSQTLENRSLNVKMLFATSEAEILNPQPDRWQDAQLHIFPTRARKTVRMQNATSLPISEEPAPSLLSTDKLYELLVEDEQCCLQLEIHDQQLFFRGMKPKDVGNYIANVPSTSLEKLLLPISKKRDMRLFLAYLLLRAFWQCYGTEWMSSVWTKLRIHFMHTVDTSTSRNELYVHAPFLSTKFLDYQTAEDTSRFHPRPKILALAIMLLEIELGDAIENRRIKEFLIDDKPTATTDFTTAQSLVDNDNLWGPLGETTDLMRVIIRKCLDTSTFNSCQDIEEEKRTIYTEMLVPLGMMVRFFRGQVEGLKFPPITSYDMQYQPPIPPQKATHIPSGRPAPLSQKAAASDRWFGRVEDFSLLLRQGRGKAGHAPVRIAILDTGIRGDHPYSCNIRGYKNFLDDGDERIDMTGHGTNGVHLLYKLLDNTEIYVARVFKKKSAEVNTPSWIVKAIEHAIHDWGVDIITMAFGFQDEDEGIKAAIKKANDAGILIFAAASNDGNVDGIAFPATMVGNVICVFSSDGNIKQSSHINPSPSISTTRNFAILGEEVQSYDHFEPGARRLNGTSMSTSIAAGIAAIVIDFARQPDCASKIKPKLLKKLMTVAGMEAVFMKMAERATDNNYNCMVPWKVLSCTGSDFEDYTDEQKREYICTTLCRALING